MLLYHLAPLELSGTTLYPLNQLKDTNPTVYAHAVSKYAGREEVMQQIIPLLNCLWNDVIFLSPVHPEKVVQARFENGLGYPTYRRNWFVLDSESLDQSQLLLYRHRPKWTMDREQHKAEYVWFEDISPSEQEELAKIPECGLWSIRKFREKGLFLGYIPHILYRGTIDVDYTNIVTC